jgi:hypothetical protein
MVHTNYFIICVVILMNKQKTNIQKKKIHLILIKCLTLEIYIKPLQIFLLLQRNIVN